MEFNFDFFGSWKMYYSQGRICEYDAGFNGLAFE